MIKMNRRKHCMKIRISRAMMMLFMNIQFDTKRRANMFVVCELCRYKLSQKIRDNYIIKIHL